MWVGIVGSRNLGWCGYQHGRSMPPSTDELDHARVCPQVVEKVRMRIIVTRASHQKGFEGIVSGGASGADSLAKTACDELHIKCVVYPPKPGPEPFWQRAKTRNQKIVDRSDMLIAVFAPGPRSPGTSDTIERALTKGIPLHVWHEGRWSTR